MKRSGSAPRGGGDRTPSRGVDVVNQMALQMRQVRRQMTWAHAVLRYAVVNAQLAGNCDFARRPLVCGSGNGKCCGGGTLPTPRDKRCTCRCDTTAACVPLLQEGKNLL